MYDHKKIEAKWQKYWEENKLFKADNQNTTKPKYYALDMFPYPSGVGLHVGHPEGYTATDIISRYKRMKGYNVLHPMGWDAFGLPAENYAIKMGTPPEETTRKNIETFTRQIKSLGFSYDWDREINTSSPEYYKWTQWFFLFLYKNGLAYKKNAPVNWCNSCQTVLANEQVVNGACERCQSEVEQKNMNQWFFKITDFIEDNGETSGLISGLDKIDWPESTKISQRNWIGKKEGIDIDYQIEGTDKKITVFTTRPDTNFGATFVVLAPEHSLVKKITTQENLEAVENYLQETSKKTEIDRMAEGRKKTGAFTGSYAINNLTGKKMPIWVSDFVLAGFGTGALVGVPGHDLRDFEFAQTFDLPIIRVVVGEDGDKSEITRVEQVQEEEGLMINSDFLNGLDIHKATEKIMDYLEEKGWGKRVTTYRLRDWLVSRQRFWGVPIPIIYCDDCGEVPVEEKDLPVKLPNDVDFKPTGESPLVGSKTFHNVKCPKCGNSARRESDTMDTFVCSSWYYLRFADVNNDQEIAAKELLDKWLPIDLYVGGAEHTVLHLLYSRFFTKALHKFDYISCDEPFIKLRHQGMILAEDGRKMSKSLGNVINPDDVVNQYGADTLRIYEMFMGPFDQSVSWNTKGTEGIYRFLQKIYRLYEEIDFTKCDCEKADCSDAPKGMPQILHKTIKKVTEDIENFRFNTAISQMMIFINFVTKEQAMPKPAAEMFLKLLAPFAPHIAEELWEKLGNTETIGKSDWPNYIEELTIDDEIELVIQVNGKLRDKFNVSKDIAKDDAISQAKEREKVRNFLVGKEIVREIFVPGKLVNLVVK